MLGPSGSADDVPAPHCRLRTPDEGTSRFSEKRLKAFALRRSVNNRLSGLPPSAHGMLANRVRARCSACQDRAPHAARQTSTLSSQRLKTADQPNSPWPAQRVRLPSRSSAPERLLLDEPLVAHLPSSVTDAVELKALQREVVLLRYGRTPWRACRERPRAVSITAVSYRSALDRSLCARTRFVADSLRAHLDRPWRRPSAPRGPPQLRQESPIRTKRPGMASSAPRELRERSVSVLAAQS